MDASAMTAKMQQVWDGAQSAYSALVNDHVQAAASDKFIEAIRAHLASSSSVGERESAFILCDVHPSIP